MSITKNIFIYPSLPLSSSIHSIYLLHPPFTVFKINLPKYPCRRNCRRATLKAGILTREMCKRKISRMRKWKKLVTLHVWNPSQTVKVKMYLLDFTCTGRSRTAVQAAARWYRNSVAKLTSCSDLREKDTFFYTHEVTQVQWWIDLIILELPPSSAKDHPQCMSNFKEDE